MGCEAQVHEKTNKCGTWAYHSINGWYLFTLPEHYCTHNCHIHHTKSKRLSNTVQLQHKHIINPSITHADKVMHALAECINVIRGMTGKARNSQAMQDLQRMIDTTQTLIHTNPHKFDKTITPDDIHNMHRVPRVQAPTIIPIPHTNDNRQITRSIHLQALNPRVHIYIPTASSISAPLITTTIKPSSKPTTPSHPNTNTIVSGKQDNCAMLLLQPAQPHKLELEHKWQQQQPKSHPRH
jgi:hypothetical protein